MKKLLLIFSIFFFCMQAWGQLSYETPKPILKANLTYPTKKLTLDITNGISIPFGNFSNIAHEGFNTGIILNRRYSKKLSFSAGINYSAFDYKSKYGSYTDHHHQYINTSFDIGPQYTLIWKRFSFNFYGRMGLSYLHAPSAIAYHPNSQIITANLTRQNTTALTSRLGSDFSANITKGLKLFISTEYVQTFNRNLNYEYRDISPAINIDGTINNQKANQIVFNKENFSLSGFNINLGVNISIGNNSVKTNYDKNLSSFYYSPNTENKLIFEAIQVKDSSHIDSVVFDK